MQPFPVTPVAFGSQKAGIPEIESYETIGLFVSNKLPVLHTDKSIFFLGLVTTDDPECEQQHSAE